REFERKLGDELRALPGFRFRFGGGESGEILDVILAGDNPASLEAAAERVERELRDIPGVGNPAATSGLKRPELGVKPDPTPPVAAIRPPPAAGSVPSWSSSPTWPAPPPSASRSATWRRRSGSRPSA